MNRILSILIFYCVAFVAHGANVVFPLGNMIQQPAASRKVLLEPADAPRVVGGQITLADKKMFVTDADGIFTATNLLQGAYIVTVQAPPAQTQFYIDVPATNGTLNATNLARITPGTNLLTYTAPQVDALFQRHSENLDAWSLFSTNLLSEIGRGATNSDQLIEGSTNLFWNDARSNAITSYALSNINSASNALQTQISANTSALDDKASLSGSNTFRGINLYTNHVGFGRNAENSSAAVSIYTHDEALLDCDVFGDGAVQGTAIQVNSTNLATADKRMFGEVWTVIESGGMNTNNLSLTGHNMVIEVKQPFSAPPVGASTKHLLDAYRADAAFLDEADTTAGTWTFAAFHSTAPSVAGASGATVQALSLLSENDAMFTSGKRIYLDGSISGKTVSLGSAYLTYSNSAAAFSVPVAASDPTASNHLATKAYVDAHTTNILTKGSNAVGDDFAITVAEEEIYNFRRNAMDKNDDTVVRFGDFNFGSGDLEVRPGWPGVVFVNTNRVATKLYVDGKFVGVLLESNFPTWAATNAQFFSVVTNRFATNSSEVGFGGGISVGSTKIQPSGRIQIAGSGGIAFGGTFLFTRAQPGGGVNITDGSGSTLKNGPAIVVANYVSGSNYEIGMLGWSNNVFQVGAQTQGGTNRIVQIVGAGLQIGSGSTITNIVTATGTLDFPSISAQSSADLTIAVSGAKANDSVALGLPVSPASGVVFNAFVSPTNTVVIRAFNITASSVDPDPATYRVTLTQF